MSNPRREFIKDLLTMSALSGLIGSTGATRAFGATLDRAIAEQAPSALDLGATDFWPNFIDAEGTPSTKTPRKRGSVAIAQMSTGNNTAPVFMHYGKDGFQNTALLDTQALVNKLVKEGDVTVSVNTSAVKIGAQDQKTFARLQNAQIRVDVRQATSILPSFVEAMAYTLVAGMHSSPKGAAVTNSKSKATAKASTKGSSTGSDSSVQSLTVTDDEAWQKMQNIPLPGGKGRWALNLEAQEKDSLLYQILESFLQVGGQFAPLIGLPGLAISGVRSFDLLYQHLHSQPVKVIETAPVLVFATEQALENAGGASASGIVLPSGTYILFPTGQLPSEDDLKSLTVTQGRLVPPKTAPEELDVAAAETLKDVTYVTFDVGITPATLIPGVIPKRAG